MNARSVLQLRPEPMTDTATVPAAPKPGRQAKMTIRGLRKTFNDAVVYDGFDLDLPLGQFISVFGPNGCGKSTLINMISGLMPMDAGEVLYDGQRISETRISYVFQNYREALFPWLKAIDNIHYPLKVMGVPRAERERRIEKLLAEFEIRIDLNAYPYTLSGGQQQTVSILRALVTEPEVLFLDEPFSALDYEMTMSMREQLQKIFMKTKTTMLLVSHDLDEAIEQADKLVLLTRRPTQVAEIVEIGLPWPRDRTVTTGDDFMAIKRHCLDRFWQEVKK
ncbi:NitT/TauT family transport system ATP-binding protein [Rhodopseudomonas thermotolerans]|uniref:NitT/TauT family transport system ATP-binding protein n=3 Tax=Nitrobacteraceae TaxID=41294 RepID=A0A336JHS0_9BRAD|nr:NitT/TauT family transport system ATP-binding protein [Rhodopseudomonas pentothenatexigens]REG07426.1 NitT/TauT family transport system ATP-binding protein [Rhodopseudomonas thermotolerans]SSW89325.1 NitT/TauT family transport system ATP-binding protein [Rhodopseudomonas pentothenatexigens]